MTRVINFCYFLVEFLCIFIIWGLLVENYLLPVFLWVKLASLGYSDPSSTFCGAAFMDMYCFNLVLSWNILFSALMVTESFAWYSNLGLHPWFLSICSTSVQNLLTFMVSTENFGEILIDLSLYVICSFLLWLLILFFLYVCFAF